MIIFCLLWIPVFYFFRRSICSRESSMPVWALLLGSVAAVTGYFYSAIINPGGFGLFRWISGFVDYVSLPVLLPLIVCFILVRFRLFPANMDYSGFILLWLIPGAVFRSINWSTPAFLIILVLVPVLWTVQAEGISFFVKIIIKYSRWYLTVPLVLCIVIIPVLATSCWWLFYCQQSLYGFLFLFICLIPAALSLVLCRSR